MAISMIDDNDSTPRGFPTCAMEISWFSSVFISFYEKTIEMSLTLIVTHVVYANWEQPGEAGNNMGVDLWNWLVTLASACPATQIKWHLLSGIFLTY